MKKLLNAYIDHTVLKPDANLTSIQTLCDEAVQYQFATIFVNPCWVEFARDRLNGSSVKLGSVVSFPLGANTPEIKAFEASHLVKLGVDEIDMVLNIGALKSQDEKLVRKDIRSVVEAAKGKIVKVIIEACLLTDDEKKLACRFAVEEGAHFVKTSTGFSTKGATVHDVALMRSIVGPNIGVKASGGIRDQDQALELIKAGADRIGTSAGVQIMQGDIAVKGAY